jgi:DNA-binding GntR family transcriptional regulator
MDDSGFAEVADGIHRSDARKVRSGGNETLALSAYRALRADIITGVRAPGERLRLERLRAIYGTGPTPLREALQRLSADRLVIAEGNRGFTVAPLDFEEFADLNTARTAVEKEALRLSIAKGDDPWEARVVAARHILQKEDAALDRTAGPVPDSWERANAAFHAALVSACGSSWLLRTRQGLHDQAERYRRAAVHQRVGSRDLAAEHAAIAEAVLARDVERAVALTEAHFALTAESLGGDPPAQTAPDSG